MQKRRVSKEAKELYDKICKESDEEVARLRQMGCTEDQIIEYAWSEVKRFLVKMGIL